MSKGISVLHVLLPSALIPIESISAIEILPHKSGHLQISHAIPIASNSNLNNACKRDARSCRTASPQATCCSHSQSSLPPKYSSASTPISAAHELSPSTLAQTNKLCANEILLKKALEISVEYTPKAKNSCIIDVHSIRHMQGVVGISVQWKAVCNSSI